MRIRAAGKWGMPKSRGSREGCGLWGFGGWGLGEDGEDFLFEKKKQVIAIGKKTGCAVELHPVEIIYNTPSILLFYCGAFHSTPRFFLSN